MNWFMQDVRPNALSAAVIVAAGKGLRAAQLHGDRVPKQYVSMAGSALLTWSVAAFLAHPDIHIVLVVIHPDDAERYALAVPTPHAKLLAPCPGGDTRQASVLNGLEALVSYDPQRVLIHDAARPFLDAGTISRVLGALDRHAGAIAAVPLADTLKRADSHGLVAETLARASLWRAQTPQGFRFIDILAAHRAAAVQVRSGFTDDAAVAEWHGLQVALVEGSERNLKITTMEDLQMAQRIVATPSDVRTGIGFDVHRFAPGDAVWLCGIKVAHTHRLEGHSDADVALHALTDALLGAIGDGDIGQHFPPSDQRWRGAASHLFLADAARRIIDRGGVVSNVDVTLLCEAPKIAPHREAMRRRIGEILAIETSRVGVKATTMEGLGSIGRGEGIAAMATATVLLPARSEA